MNPWIIVPNVSGIMIGLFFTLSIYPLCSAAQKQTMNQTFMAYGLLFASVLAGLRFGLISAAPAT